MNASENGPIDRLRQIAAASWYDSTLIKVRAGDVRAILAALPSTPLAEGSLDRAILADTLRACLPEPPSQRSETWT